MPDGYIDITALSRCAVEYQIADSYIDSIWICAQTAKSNNVLNKHGCQHFRTLALQYRGDSTSLGKLIFGHWPPDCHENDTAGKTSFFRRRFGLRYLLPANEEDNR